MYFQSIINSHLEANESICIHFSIQSVMKCQRRETTTRGPRQRCEKKLGLFFLKKKIEREDFYDDISDENSRIPDTVYQKLYDDMFVFCNGGGS